jgi:hypothetical protein
MILKFKSLKMVLACTPPYATGLVLYSFIELLNSCQDRVESC